MIEHNEYIVLFIPYITLGHNVIIWLLVKLPFFGASAHGSPFPEKFHIILYNLACSVIVTQSQAKPSLSHPVYVFVE
jgi:hypothetical protein